MDTKYLKRVGLYILSVILALALIFYLVYHMLDGFTTDISTIPAEIQVNRSVISADGYIFRDEEYLFSSYDGAVDYMVKEGEKVSLNQEVARTFSDSSGNFVLSRISEIENKLAVLKNSEVKNAAANSDTEATDKKIVSYYYSVLSNISEGKYDNAVRASQSMLVQLNRRGIITGERNSYHDIVASLETEKSNLEAKLTGRNESVFSNTSGYFSKSVDGYENIFTKDAALSLTVSSFYDIISKEPTITVKNIIGKISKDYIWYIAIPVSLEKAGEIEVGNNYRAVFPYNYDRELTLTAEKISVDIRDDKAVALFSCGEIPSDFSFARVQNVEIILSSSSGFRVPMSSVRLLDGYEGVYTLYGSTVIFKRIDILFETDGYYMVSTIDPIPSSSPDNETNTDSESETNISIPKYEYIGLYDRIIVEGKELEHGMVFY
ncbi:MAG: HlyD family efflux transporter periplasmic adaptor subunit [Clostridia bacterium]|nr:HlyD family efflux transporter periplasmic adaptor subunit [Clostridia bacterium]